MPQQKSSSDVSFQEDIEKSIKMIEDDEEEEEKEEDYEIHFRGKRKTPLKVDPPDKRHK